MTALRTDDWTRRGRRRGGALANVGWIACAVALCAGCIGKGGGAGTELGDAGTTTAGGATTRGGAATGAGATTAAGATTPPGSPATSPPRPPPQDGPLSNVDDLGRAPREQLPTRQAPLELTSSDGQGLQLRRLLARAVVDGPLSHCELRLTFRNPEARRREGRFSLTLPDHATIGRFAMKTGGRWMEGEVVEKQRARVVYEDFLHRRQDPALLELEAGNRFTARVFPIEPNEDKEIIVAWSAERTDPTASWTLPLAGLPQLDELDVRVFVHDPGGSPATLVGAHGATVRDRREVRVHRFDIQPAVDLEVRPGVLDAGWNAIRAGRIAVVRVDAAQLDPSEGSKPAAGANTPGSAGDPGDHDATAAPLSDVVALVDTSASGALALETRLRQLDHLARRVARDRGTLRVVAFDQGTTTLFRGPASELAQDTLDALRRRGALGATDLGQALDAIADVGRAPARVVLLSDGVATAGERDGARLAERLATLAGLGLRRLDAVTATAARDDAMLQRLSGGPLPDAGLVIHAGAEASWVERLGRRTLAPIEFEVDGAAWLWPDRLVGLEADGSALVWVELPHDDAPLVLRARGGASGEIRPDARGGDERLLRRAWARARVAMLESQYDQGDAGVRAAIERKAVELSLTERVLSRWTALLVLESDADYARYGIGRSNRAAILAIGDDGVTNLASRDAAGLGPGGKGNKDLLEALGQPTDPPVERPQRADDDMVVPPAPQDRNEAPREGAGAPAGSDARERSRPAMQPESVRSRQAAEPKMMAAAPAAAAPGAEQGAARPAKTAAAAAPSEGAAPRRTEGDGAANQEAEAPAAADPAPVPQAAPAQRAPAADDGGGVVITGQGTGGGGQGAARGFGRRGSVEADRRTRPLGAQAQVLGSHRILRVENIGHSELDVALHRSRAAWSQCLTTMPAALPRSGHMQVDLGFGSGGAAQLVRVVRHSGLAGSVISCVERQLLRHLRRSGGGELAQAKVMLQFQSHGGAVAPPPPPTVTPRPPAGQPAELRKIRADVAATRPSGGILAEVDRLLAAATGDADKPALPGMPGEALAAARRHVATQAADLRGYVALGRALAAAGDPVEAARAYGSLIDLYPGRADIRRFAGNLLETLPAPPAVALAHDTYAVAANDRRDHPTGWLMRAIAEARAGRHARAIELLDEGLRAPRRAGNFPAYERTARELMATFGAAALPIGDDLDAAKEPEGVRAILLRHQVQPDRRAGTRLLLTWENDANDVDLHVFDPKASHAFYKRRQGAGGEIFADVTTGWGPECFLTRVKDPRLQVFVHSYRQGPMGFAMGRVVIIHSDGKGGASFEHRPFVIERDRGYIDLGSVRTPRG